MECDQTVFDAASCEDRRRRCDRDVGGRPSDGPRRGDGKLLWECGGFNPKDEGNWRTIASPSVSDGMAIVPLWPRRFFGGRSTLGGSGDITKIGAESGKKAEKSTSADVPTAVTTEGKAYVLNDAGHITCFDLKTGDIRGRPTCRRVGIGTMRRRFSRATSCFVSGGRGGVCRPGEWTMDSSSWPGTRWATASLRRRCRFGAIFCSAATSTCTTLVRRLLVSYNDYIATSEGDAKMTTDQLDQVHQAKPFKPFTIHLADGTKHRVVSPEFMWRTPGGRTIFVSTGPEAAAIIDLLLVTKITIGNGERRRRRRAE